MCNVFGSRPKDARLGSTIVLMMVAVRLSTAEMADCVMFSDGIVTTWG